MNVSRREVSAMLAGSTLVSTAGCIDFLAAEETEPAIGPTDWPSFQRTARNHGYTEAGGPGDEPTERWRVDLPGGVGEQVAVVDGTVYVCTEAGSVHALDAKSGDEEWAEHGYGAKAHCPCVVDGQVVFGTETGDIVALDRTDGSEAWTTELSGPVAGPTPAGDELYVGTTESPRVYALGATDGEIEWNAPVDAPVVDYPAVTDDAVYVGTENTAMLQGWIHRVNRESGDVTWTREGSRMQSPAVADETIYAPSLTMEVYEPSGFRSGVQSVSGHILWTPAVTDGTSVVIGTGGILATKSRDDGPDWILELEGRPHSGPVVAEDRVYLVGDEAVLVGIDYQQGEVQWRRPLDGEFGRRPAVADDALFVGTSDGALYAFE
ncbi:WD40-like repeat protein [Halovivax ruber XH-70]|uniref:WD40-like repeat protein n=1 Tax=Halovivax ruber (strain DSM 18193 / JCM 13892 / XH-70) TaxID=797302 RepID=L0I7U6_HALRX|nr:PQQ-binding-like beta-propeller repeat protein [Halovivax ruber]AGB14848.1 WD40-like repeat protein [Halovivax ruber XH-70]